MRQKLLKIWYIAGRILPLTALALLILVLVFDLDTWINVLASIIIVVFATIAFVWWWWVLDTVKDLYKTLNTAQEKFDSVINELKDIRKDIDVSFRERNKSKKDKS